MATLIANATPTDDQKNKINAFFTAHELDNDSVRGRAWQAINAALNGMSDKFKDAHHNYVGVFKAQALTDNRIQRATTAGTLPNDAAIRGYANKIADAKTAGLLYA